MRLLSRFILILIFSCSSFLFSQTNMLDTSPSRIKSKISIPPLDVVMDSVLKKNAMLNFRKHHIGVKDATVKSEKLYWSRNFGVQADTRYGTLNNFSTNEDGQVSSAIATTSKQFNYSVGFYLKFPLFDVLNRKHQLRLARLELEEAKSMAQFQEDEIRQTVIAFYQDLVLKEKLLQIKSKSLGDGKVNMQMVEKEFRNGVVPISEYVRITSITGNMETDYEKAKSDFMLAKQLLEDMAGFKFDIVTTN